MIGFTKRIESFYDAKYRDLNYGTIYYVAGTATQELNNYVKNFAEEIEAQLNSDERNWIACKIVYLDAENTFFKSSKKAVLYSAMLPFEGSPTDANIFFAAYLDIIVPKVVEDAISQYFSTLQQMFDEVLDTGCYQEYHLRKTILSATDDGILFSITRSRDDEIRCSVHVPKPLPFTEPSRLEITPYNHPILLPDYNLEIRFGAQVKALYILFLRHPEGIRMKEIADYKDEFKKIYFCFSNRSNTEKLQESVDKLLDVCNPNAMNVKKSQCNSIIRYVIPNEELNRYYIIEVVRGEQHKINLDRSLVTMPECLS